MLIAAIVGFVSGITGVGGGIFLAPLVLSFGWVETRRASAIFSTQWPRWRGLKQRSQHFRRWCGGGRYPLDWEPS